LRISSEKQLTSGRTVFHNPSPSGRGKGEGKREEAKPGVDSLLDHLVCNSVKITLILAFLLGVATLGYPAEPFYQGKTLRVVVASAAGGGSDIVARLMMRHLSRHIPGNPTIIGQGNMIKDPVWKGIGVEVPSLAEAYRSMYGKDPSGPEWEAEKALVGGYSLTRLMAMSPKTAAAQVAELRKAFSAMGQDPAFLADWGKSQGAAPRLIPGNEAGDIVASILKARKEAVNILKRLAKP
jgi:hypothetical protein